MEKTLRDETTEQEELRKPSEEESSDWNSAWHYALGEKAPAVRHLVACIFGENDGPDWIWIFQTDDMKFAWLKAGCDYTGWDCQSDGSWKGGFESIDDAIEGVPDCAVAQKTLLLAQARGERPYGLS